MNLKEQLRVGVVGSRRRNTLHDRKIVFGFLDRLIELNPHREIVIVSGACPKGADAFAAEYARITGVSLVEFPVPKVSYGSRGEFAQAAFARNKLIADDSVIGLALVAMDRTGGTENTVKHYTKQGKKVYLADDDCTLYLSLMEKGRETDVTKDPDKA